MRAFGAMAAAFMKHRARGKGWDDANREKDSGA
jgi:hypothetical protein